ncbi:MAG TPA: hypothetical protein VGR54_03815 [Nitrosopumilaceae archaeon]|nr:hypothetical protein [Nitrosopumilaceae archaeon]
MKVLIIVLILILAASVCVVTLVTNAYAIGIEARNQEGKLVFGNSESSSHAHNAFEFGVWAFPILATNLILLLLGILYYKKRLPAIVKKIIDFILNFEVSRKIALIIVISLIAIYVIFNVSKIWNPEEESWGDYQSAVSGAKNWSFVGSVTLNSGSDLVIPFLIISVRYLLLSISLNILGNIRIIPFTVSILLLVVTYYLTSKLSKKRFAGIISIVILLQSNLFLKYSVSATEDNTWTLFYVLSLYLIYKKWFLSPLSYALSLFSKPLVAIFLPVTFFFIYMSTLSKKEKTKTILLYIITILIPAIIMIYLYRSSRFDYNEFWAGFAALNIFLRFDGLVLMFLLPLIVGLFITSRRGILHADSVMVLIMGVLLSAPLLASLADITNQPYRFVPLVVFFAIGVGTLLSNKISEPVQTKKNHVSVAVFLITLATVLISLTLVILPAL